MHQLEYRTGVALVDAHVDVVIADDVHVDSVTDQNFYDDYSDGFSLNSALPYDGAGLVYAGAVVNDAVTV